MRSPAKRSPSRNVLARALRKAARIIEPEPEIIQVQDEFVSQLCFVNAGILEKGNIYSIEYAISQLRSDAPILEIGSLCGLSSNILSYYKRKYDRTNALITCDKWHFQRAAGDESQYLGKSGILYSDFQAFAKETYIRNVRMFSATDLPRTFEMFSDEFFACWQAGNTATDILGREYILGGPLSFCFIDGNHTYEFVKRDFLNCDAFLEVGGFILFDDSTLLKDDVHMVMPEVIATGRYTLVAMNPYHLFQKTGPKPHA